jgi:L-amino acid N-acyltransferase YncA
MKIEPATLNDCPAIAQIHVQSWQQAYKDLLPKDYLATLSIKERENMWRKTLQAGSPHLLVARVEDEIQGFIAFGSSRDRDAKQDCAEIWATYLAPSAWSKGFGKRMLLGIKDALRQQGFKTLSLWAILGNERAGKFYLNAGFSAEPESIQSFPMGGVELQEIRYVMHI